MKYYSIASRNVFSLLVCIALAAPSFAHAASCSAESGKHKVAIVELYTSEGCSSCPSADKWLSKIHSKGLNNERVIPLALHVDYWNKLGWHDKFSQAKFTARQRQYSARRHSSFIYTPQIFLDGAIYRPGLIFDDIDDKVKEINGKLPMANIDLRLEMPETSIFGIGGRMEITNDEQIPHAVAYVAVLQNNLANYVIAGENKGTLLFHNFVVRELLGPFPVDESGEVEFKQQVILPENPDPKYIVVAAFVQNKNTGDVLQALALNACK
jgi:hypothetical protein